MLEFNILPAFLERDLTYNLHRPMVIAAHDTAEDRARRAEVNRRRRRQQVSAQDWLGCSAEMRLISISCPAEADGCDFDCRCLAGEARSGCTGYGREQHDEPWGRRQ